MKNVLYIITGISRGLGYYLAKEILADNNSLVGLGKSKINVEYDLDYIHCDLKSISNVEKANIIVREKISNYNYSKIIFINNASIIKPIAKIGELESIQDISNVNYVSPMILINNLVKVCGEKLEIYNITSGAAENYIIGWSLYNSTKKAIKVYLDTLALESPNIKVMHFDPGVMDTAMQHDIRESHFELQQQFIKYKEEKQLKSASFVAKEIYKRVCN